ncbi:hypothetical protein [Mesorhizobium shangrilense]|uniref:Uncharacterized protein n=1 Tax=Mesorhizobium shangrilense TaxID=460060 RepID=A0ABV2DQW1_9HYPH
MDIGFAIHTQWMLAAYAQSAGHDPPFSSRLKKGWGEKERATLRRIERLNRQMPLKARENRSAGL